MSAVHISRSPLRHTYPYGSDDMELPFGTAESMRTGVSEVFAAHPECRRIVIAVPEGDLDAVSECEAAGLRYVVDVETREGADVSLMVAEPDWLTRQSTDISELELK
ncbi:hypothetical protein JIM95_003480 [Corynebacterium sp. CCM 8835]|nr:hypothetical protein [Corynebacterium antarcticum]MCK7641990.1 hypothetical protein [Corynebacterium antarcticum]MCL0245214.1 hypothetical protein [Corynebacterium antarcticum]MCX7492949.1 hypothetical protein [Corynebacterium antarcticum]MCX7539232.1 hypothetical protein [Corynebacterium antarcticum]